MVPPAALASQRREFSVAVPAAAGLILVFGALLLPWTPLSLREAASSAGLLLAGGLATVSCAIRARRETGRRRRAWLLLVAAAVVAILSNLWSELVGSDPVTSPSTVTDVGLAIALLLSIACVINFPSARRRGVDLLVMGLDGVVMGAGVLVITTVLVYSELLDPASASASRLLSLLLPLLDVVLVTLALLLYVRTRGPWRPALGLVAAGFLTYAVSDLSFAVLVSQGTFHFGTVLDLGWIAGYILVSLAAWIPSPVDAVEHDVGGSEVRDTVLVFAVLTAAVVVQVVAGNAQTMPVAQAGLWLILVLAVGLRQVMLAWDNTALRRGLERRVREQTADLRRLARQTEVLLTSVGDGIYGVDADGRITFVNPSGSRVLGHPAHDLLGAHAHDAFHAPTPDGTPYPYERCYVAEAISSGTVTSAEEDVYVRADGELIPVEISASPLLDEDVVRGAVVVFRDMTQRREVDRMKNEFLSVVSHELRTPLTSIRGSLGLLESGALGELSPRAASLTSIAIESSERLTRLINDILDLERIESGSRALEAVATDARELVKASVTELQGLARDGGIQLDLGPCGGWVLADRDLIVQTLTNLVGNAIKFSEKGGRVVVGAEEQDGQVLFRVRDWGRGIPDDRLEAVFERFAQVDSSDARSKGGTGLGLAISREIVERHGGRIWAESELGVGTTLLFTLPAARSPQAGADAVDAPTVWVCVPEGGTLNEWSAALAGHGYRALPVADGAGTAQPPSTHPPAAVLLDLRGAETAGGSWLAGLRATEPTRNVPVLVLSGPDAGAVHSALDGDGNDHTVLVMEADQVHTDALGAQLGARGWNVVHAATAADIVNLGGALSPQAVVLGPALRRDSVLEAVWGLRGLEVLRQAPLVVYGSADGDDASEPSHTGSDRLQERIHDLLDAVTGRSA